MVSCVFYAHPGCAPWLRTGQNIDLPLCENVTTIDEAEQIVNDLNYDKTAALDCETRRCNFPTYEVQIQDSGEKMVGTNVADVVLILGSPYIQVIEDRDAYSILNLIGEVGGMLGLLMGLSFLSFVDLLKQGLKWGMRATNKK